MLYLALLFCSSCGSKSESAITISADSIIVAPDSSTSMGDTMIPSTPDTETLIQVIVFKNDSTTNGYGYDIMVNGKKMIHQPTIPAVTGNRGFHSESDAQNAGALVKRKLLNNEMPPTISLDELNALGIH